VKHTFLALGLIAALSGASSLVAQEAPAVAKPDAAKPAAPARNLVTPMRLQVTVSRYQGEKKISSLPYSLSVSMGGPRVQFRVGAQVPIATTTVNDGTKTPSYSYRDVGIGIDVMNQNVVEPGLYRMEVHVNDNSISSSSQIQGSPAITGVPIFRTFSTNGTVILRDGQTTQLTTAADPITGEIMRVDVTLTAAK
jgi:hypothetical protein